MTDHTGVSTEGFLGRESRPEALFDNQDKFSVNNLVGSRGLTVLEHAHKAVCARMCSAVWFLTRK